LWEAGAVMRQRHACTWVGCEEAAAQQQGLVVSSCCSNNDEGRTYSNDGKAACEHQAAPAMQAARHMA
jgi:hypothetical protein